MLMNGSRRKGVRLRRSKQAAQSFRSLDRACALLGHFFDDFSEPPFVTENVDNPRQCKLQAHKSPGRRKQEQCNERKETSSGCESLMILVEESDLTPFGNVVHKPDCVLCI